MTMMMTGRVLLVCALCVLWCGVFVAVAEEPGGEAVPGMVPLGSTQQQITGDSQRKDKDAKGEKGQGRDANSGDGQPPKKEELDEQQSQEQARTQQDAQAIIEKATPQPAGKSSEEGEIDGDSDVENEINVLGDGERNEEGVQSQEEVASEVKLNDSQRETLGGIRTGHLRGKSQQEGENEGDDGGKKERDQHQEENKRKLQEQNQIPQQQQQQQKQKQDQGREHSEYNQKESTKDKNGVGTNQTAIKHNSNSSTAALRSDAGTEDTPTANHPSQPSTEGATPPETTSDGEAASADKYDTVSQSAGSTTPPTTNATTGDTAKPGDSDSSTAVSHTTSPLLLLLVVACAAAAAVVAA
ncbi:mucin-associated surface protein [Trypanosoma cruzi cruzi]|nr:mucin-associated surface protein [Trypanosoma cruzi cruzi]